MFASKAARIALTAVGLAATGTALMPTDAEAHPRRYYHRHHGGGGGAFVGGMILGGVLGATAARPYYYNARPRAYYYSPRYSDCRMVWRYDRWGDRYRARVCY